MITVTRYHDISAGHRVFGHETKCKHLHGHNYRIYFTLTAKKLDRIGRVIDFSVIKSLLCEWLEQNWDHKTLLYKKDPYCTQLISLFGDDIVSTTFNPTAENMAEYLVENIGPSLLKGLDCQLIKVIVEETRKCKAAYEK